MIKKLITLLVVVTSLSISFPAEAKVVHPRVPATYFGMHYLGVSEGTFPEVPVGSTRLWDSGVSWREINPGRGVFDFTRLDAAVSNARAHGSSVMLVLGQTPLWAAANPAHSSVYGTGAGSYPLDHRDWVSYVTTVATRYRGQIDSYETWNEANLSMFSSITPTQMARLQSLAYRTIKAIDPAAIVTSPSVTLRGTTGRKFLLAFAKAGGFRYADVINAHGYPEPDGTPERAITLTKGTRSALRAVGVVKPFWDTELNYGLPWGGNGLSEPLTATDQAAYVVRTYLLNWSAGVERVHWYNWSSAPFLGVQMSEVGPSASPSGKAFGLVQRWIKGTRLEPCKVDSKGTYSCKAGARGVVRWNPQRRVTVDVNGARLVTVHGQYLSDRAAVRVGGAPIFFKG